MRKLTTLILAFCLLNASFLDFQLSISNLHASGIEGFECKDTDDPENMDQSSCTFSAKVEDSGAKDGFISLQQLTLLFVVLNGVTMLGRCILTATKGCQCQGWSTATLVGAMTAVLAGEIIEMVQYEDISKELSTTFDIQKIRNHGDICSKKDVAVPGMTEEEVNDYCDGQISPLKKLVKALEAESYAAAAKMWLYGVATASTLAGTILEIVGATKDLSETIAEKVTLTSVAATCTSEATAQSSNPATAAIAAATTACVAFIKKAIVENSTIKVQCEGAKALPLSLAFCKACTNPKVLIDIGHGIELKTACNTCTSGVAQTQIYALNTHTRATNQANPSTPASFSALSPPTSMVATNDINPYIKYFKKYFSSYVGFKKAYADSRQDEHDSRFWTSIASTLGGVATFFTIYLTSWKTQDYFHKGNVTRAIFSGIQAALLGINTKYASDLEDQLDKRIASLKSLIEKIEAGIETPKIANNNEKTLLDDDVGRDFEQQFLQSFDETFKDNQSPCAFGEAPDGKGGCLSQDKAFAQTIDGLNLDGVVGQTTEDIRDFSNEISGANKASEKLLALGKSLSAKRDPLKKILKKALGDLNDLRDKNDIEPLDFEKEVANGVLKLTTAVDEALKQQGIPIASLKPVGSSAAKTSKKDTVKKAKKKVVAKKDDKAKTTDSGFSFKFDKQVDPNAGITDDSINALREKTDKYKIDKGDISKRSKDDIFKMITTRYFKSALPVLVEEVK
jgi:hypothetical protein